MVAKSQPSSSLGGRASVKTRGHTKDVVVLRDLAVSDLFREGRVTQVGVGVQARVPQLLRDLLGVLLVRRRDGDDDDLPGREPEGPLARKVFGQDGREPLDRAEDRAVDHDRSDELVSPRAGGDVGGGIGATFGGTVGQVETLRELEVELDRRALVLATEGVRDGDVDLGAVEGAVTRVDGPRARHKLVERLGQHLCVRAPNESCVNKLCTRSDRGKLPSPRQRDGW